jgi:phage terminase small subunit
MAVSHLKTKTKPSLLEVKTPPPEHLSKKMKALWKVVLEHKKLDPHEIVILIKACEAHDRGEQARHILKRKGLTFEDRFQQPRSRPEIAVERDSRAAFAKLIDSLNLWSIRWNAEDHL